MIKLLKKLGFTPRVAVWELTLQCGLRCRHCGSRAGKARDDELSLGEALDLCRQLAAAKCRFVTLSGGEPLMRKDWPLIAEKLIELGITTGMISNGILFNAKTARLAKTIGLESVAFSLDGFQETHEYQRRVKGQWQNVLDAIEHAKAAGLKVSLVTTVNNRNMEELPALREFIRDRGVKRWQLQFATPTGNMADNRSLLMQPEDLLTVVPLISKMCADGEMPRVYPGHDVGYYGEPEEGLRTHAPDIPFWTGCSAGCSVLGIESNGNIKGCLSLPSEMNGTDRFIEGNIRKTSLAEIWNRKGAFAYNREFTVESLGGFCRTCDYAEVCRGGCTWTTYAEGGPVRDNPYCYWRQLQEKEAREGKPPKRLPMVH